MYVNFLKAAFLALNLLLITNTIAIASGSLIIEAKSLETIPLLDSKGNKIKNINLKGEEYTELFHSIYTENVELPKHLKDHKDIKELVKAKKREIKLTKEEYQNIYAKAYSSSNSKKENEIREIFSKILSKKYPGKFFKIMVQQKTEDRLKNPLTSLALRKTSSEVTELGYHLVATKHIPKLTVLFLYSGTFIQAIDYSNQTLKTQPKYATKLTEHIGICADKQGGLSRFMPHLPNDLNNFSVSSETKQTLTTANVWALTTIIQKKPVLTIVSSRDISAGEPIGLSYGDLYWEGLQKRPLLFTTSGALLDPSLYTHKTCNNNTCLNKFNINTKLKKCSRCKSAYYCNIACQRKDWQNHKPQCKKTLQSRKSSLNHPYGYPLLLQPQITTQLTQIIIRLPLKRLQQSQILLTQNPGLILTPQKLLRPPQTLHIH